MALAGSSAADAALSVPMPGDRGAHGAASKRGGTLNMLVEPEPPTLVALTSSADPSLLVSAKATEGLLSYDFDLNPKPQMATHWSVSPDGRQIVFRLRKGVAWHDGATFTSRDVAFSTALLKEVHPRGRTTFAGITEVRRRTRTPRSSCYRGLLRSCCTPSPRLSPRSCRGTSTKERTCSRTRTVLRRSAPVPSPSGSGSGEVTSSTTGRWCSEAIRVA